MNASGMELARINKKVEQAEKGEEVEVAHSFPLSLFLSLFLSVCLSLTFSLSLFFFFFSDIDSHSVCLQVYSDDDKDEGEEEEESGLTVVKAAPRNQTMIRYHYMSRLGFNPNHGAAGGY